MNCSRIVILKAVQFVYDVMNKFYVIDLLDKANEAIWLHRGSLSVCT
jgi:poly(3-hydroxyalkanoate) synthetase